MYTFEQKRQAVKHIYFEHPGKKIQFKNFKRDFVLAQKNFHWNVDVPHTLNWGGGPSALVLRSGPP